MAQERGPHACQEQNSSWRSPGRRASERVSGAAGIPSPQLFPWLAQGTQAVLHSSPQPPSLSGGRFTFGLSCSPPNSLDGVCENFKNC